MTALPLLIFICSLAAILLVLAWSLGQLAKSVGVNVKWRKLIGLKPKRESFLQQVQRRIDKGGKQ
jgi:hypothetical protein